MVFFSHPQALLFMLLPIPDLPNQLSMKHLGFYFHRLSTRWLMERDSGYYVSTLALCTLSLCNVIPSLILSLTYCRGINKGCHGWSVHLKEDNHRYELPGFDYVLDLISEMELPPDLPVQESSFLVSSELVQDERLPRRRMANMVVKR